MNPEELLKRYAAGERNFYSNDYIDLSGANLQNAQLSEANLSCIEMSGINLSQANLNKSDLSDTGLTGANLSKANLSQANLQYAQLDGANLNGASLCNANLSWANLQGTDLTHIPHPNCHKGVFTEHFFYEENKNRLWIFA